MRIEEETVEDVPAGDYAMEVDKNDSSSSEDSSGFGNIRLNTHLKCNSPLKKMLEELRQKYVAFFATTMEADESIMVETADPNKKGEPIKTIDNFPEKNDRHQQLLL